MPKEILYTQNTKSVFEIANEIAQALEETAIERDRKGGTAYEERDLIRKSGLLKLFIPKKFGGLEKDWNSIFKIIQIFSRVDSSIAHLFGFHHLILASIELYGSEEQKKFYFHKTAKENLFWGNALNPLDKGTKVVKVNNKYIFDGSKGFSSGSVDSNMLLISGYFEEKLVVGVVPSDRKGIQINADWNNFGQRQTDSGTVVFNQVILHEDEMLLKPGPLGDIKSSLRSCLAQLILVHVYNGIAEGAMNAAKNYTLVQTRSWLKANAQTAKEDPYILSKYGNMWLGIQAANSLTKNAVTSFQQAWELGNAITENQRGKCALDIALAKVQSIRSGLEVCNTMFEVTGSRATNGNVRMDRYWRNLRTHSLHDPVDYKLKELGDWALNEIIPTPGFYS